MLLYLSAKMCHAQSPCQRGSPVFYAVWFLHDTFEERTKKDGQHGWCHSISFPHKTNDKAEREIHCKQPRRNRCGWTWSWVEINVRLCLRFLVAVMADGACCFYAWWTPLMSEIIRDFRLSAIEEYMGAKCKKIPFLWGQNAKKNIFLFWGTSSPKFFSKHKICYTEKSGGRCGRSP